MNPIKRKMPRTVGAVQRHKEKHITCMIKAKGENVKGENEK